MALSKIKKEKSVQKMVQQDKELPGDCKNMVIRHFRKYHNYLFVPPGAINSRVLHGNLILC